MDETQSRLLVEQLVAGFEALQGEYRTLFAQQGVVERKLATAREQYNELAKLCGSGPLATPPLSLSSLSGQQREAKIPYTAAEILAQKSDQTSQEAARKVRAALTAIQSLRRRNPETSASGVKIWSGPSADKPEPANSSLMPSISESPLEQDFTIEGTPSRLGCPFASMSAKKLSSHAASVLSRYNTGGSCGAPSTPLSSVSRVNGRETQSRRESRRTSFADPIKTEICGLSNHNEEQPPEVEDKIIQALVDQPESADVGVCPIRFLDQHSPEEVATYFENHKHEIPRSHEICVRRYQSNEEQIRELDAKYGNIVSMIQGLGARHKGMLPEDPDLEQENETAVEDARGAEKIGQWVSDVSVQAADGQDVLEEEQDGEVSEERQPHFERPLRDIRVGESPSRPWGISIPSKYLEKAEGSETSSRPVQVTSPPLPEAPAEPHKSLAAEKPPPGRCPFGFDKAPAQTTDAPPQPALKEKEEAAPPPPPQRCPIKPAEKPVFIDTPKPTVAEVTETKDSQRPNMVFNGPVFIGYSAEDAAKILRESGHGGIRKE